MGVHKALRRSHDPVCVVCERPVERREQGPGQMVWVHADTGSQYAPNPPEMEALMHDDQRDYAEEEFQRRHVEEEGAAEAAAEDEFAAVEADILCPHCGGYVVVGRDVGGLCPLCGADTMPDREYGHPEGTDPNEAENARLRLEYLRGCLRAERISLGELIELQNLVPFIDPSDVELLEAAGVPEFPEDCEFRQDDEHEWHCTTHGVTMIGPEPVHCSVAREGEYPKPAAPMIVDAYGNLWPAHFIVCQKCGQPDNCGDCNHGRLTPDEVRQLGGTPA